ncbi:MAG: hypothetical protein ING29_12475 [Azospirillum sp.]|nr:hypothetical protein [Azospirillum sp.]
MDRDLFIAQAVIAGKTRAQALALYAVAFPPAPAPAPDAVVGFKREFFPDGRMVETEFLGDGRERVTQQRQADE